VEDAVCVRAAVAPAGEDGSTLATDAATLPALAGHGRLAWVELDGASVSQRSPRIMMNEAESESSTCVVGMWRENVHADSEEHPPWVPSSPHTTIASSCHPLADKAVFNAKAMKYLDVVPAPTAQLLS